MPDQLIETTSSNASDEFKVGSHKIKVINGSDLKKSNDEGANKTDASGQQIKGDEDTTTEKSLTSENEDDEDDDNDDDDNDDDEPPKLKYIRLTQLPAHFFTRDSISTCSFHESVFLFATHSGILHITKPDLSPIRTFKAHRASVLSIYTDGTFFATGSMDGTIVIGSIEDEKDITAFDFKRPIHAVVLDKRYHKTRSFISGGMSGKVIYSSKNWLGQRSDVVLDQDNGPIVAIQSIDDLLFWMNDKGITIYHIATKQVISTIPKPDDSPRGDLYWPRFHFPEVDRILIAWGNYIWSLRASIRNTEDSSDGSASTRSKILPSSATMSFRAVQEKKIEIEHVFKFESLISGISSFKDDLWMILTFNPPEKDEKTNKLHYNCPDLKLINSITGAIEHEEEIGLKDVDGLGLNDYLLGSHIGDNTASYFIMSAKDGVIAKETQMSDRLNWYLDNRKYLEAWNISQHLVLPIKRINIGILYVDSLMKYDDWYKAAQCLSTLLFIDQEELPDSDTKSTVFTGISLTLQNEEYDQYIQEIVSQWTIWSGIFIKSDHIEELTKVIPTSTKLNLSQDIYTRILEYWIGKASESDTFFTLIKTWDTELFNVKHIQSILETLLEDDESTDNLRSSLAALYVKSYEPIKAAKHLIHLKDPNIIKFLSVHHILINFINDFPHIIAIRFENKELEQLPIDELRKKLEDFIDILVENRHEIHPSDIIKLMSDNHLSFINFFYLESLASIDEFLISQYGNERMSLYASYDRLLLLPFLTKHNNYDIDKAIELCEANDFTEELVYLLGKIGENKKALMLIINELSDPEKAIKFAKHQNDKEAWSILLDYSMAKPNFIKALIECADDQSNSFYDPIDILERMPSHVSVDGLKNSVTKISANNDINLILNQLTLKIVYKQSEKISSHYKQGKLKGIEVEAENNKLSRLIEEYETILMYRKPSSDETHLVGESELLNGKKLHLCNTSFSGLSNKIDHWAILDDILKEL